MIAAILRAHFGDEPVLATQGNLNNAIGLPLTLLGLTAQHRAAVVEIGHEPSGRDRGAGGDRRADRRRRSTTRSASIRSSCARSPRSRPSTRRWLRALPAGGVAVLNADDAFVDVWREAAAEAGRVTAIEFGLDHPAAVRGRYAPRQAGGVVDLVTPAGDATVAARQLADGTTPANALAAATAALAIGVPLRRSCAASRTSARLPVGW